MVLNPLKAFVIGFSLYTLSPIIRYTSDVRSEFEAVLFSSDGEVLFEYDQTCKGKCKYNCFYPMANAVQGTRGCVWKKHVECLVDQMKK